MYLREARTGIRSTIRTRTRGMKHLLYNNTIELHFDEAKHLYTVNGVKVDGTTSVLGVINKPALIYWAVNQAVSFFQATIKAGVSYDEIQLKAMAESMKASHRKKTGDAADIGKMVHQWIQDYIAGKNPSTPVNKQINNAVSQFLKWEKENDIEFIHSERLVYSKKYNYAGTLDFLAKVNGRILLGDFKTSSGIWDEMWFQTSAYQQAFSEEFPNVEITGQAIVRVGKDAVLEVKESRPEDYSKNVEAFNSALVLHRRIIELKEEAWKAKNKNED